MKLEPYWESPEVKKASLTRHISTCPLQPVERILKVKREAARKACSKILKEDREVEVVALLGSVARGDIIGWFSDIDTLVITGKPRQEEMIFVDHQPLFVERHNWASFEDLLVRKIARDEYEERSSYLSYYGNPIFLHSSRSSRARYQRLVKLGTQSLWKDHSQIDEYLDDFVWFYGSSIEAVKHGLPLTGVGKLQRGATFLLRYFLIQNKILLRKPLPDKRTIDQLRESEVPKELVDFVRQMHEGKSDIETLLQRAREMYLKVTDGRRWFEIAV